MNPELLECLRRINFEGADSPDAWRRVVIVVNYGCVPARPGELEKGFKMLLLDKTGATSWFARCGWASPDAMEREVSLLAALGQDTFARLHVPESRSARGARLFLQASRYLGDTSYRSVLAHRTPSQWEHEVGEILATSARLMRAAQAAHAPIQSPPSVVKRKEQIERDLATLGANGVSKSVLHSLSAALSGIEHIPAELQHGDLWPANVLRTQGRWWFIDFTETGMVWNPLYDVFHLLTYAPSTSTTSWYAVHKTGDRWGRSRLRVYSRALAQRSLDARAGGKCLAFYLTHLTAYRLRPGISRSLGAGMLGEVERAGHFLAAHGNDPASLMPES